jgi:murein DD-endopeptidase MepM/ murein hydrolase activator NlpD
MNQRIRLLGLVLSGLCAATLALPAAGPAAETLTTTTTTPSSPPQTTSTPAPEAPAAAPPVATESIPVPPPPGQPGAGAPAVTTTPQIQAQRSQGSTPGRAQSPSRGHAKSAPGGPASVESEANGATGPSSAIERSRRRPPRPSTLTPSLPLALESSIAGVPAFFIESFRVPPFLLPIYQAAGTAYGIPWQVLAAINEVETDYGRDLSVSSAGAEGWMQFLPAEWAQYGVDANGDGFKDPYNPADAIFAAARYLRAAGGTTNIRAAVYSYNHSQAYVDSVMLRAQLLGGTPPGLLGAITGLTEARFPVHAASHFSDGFPIAPSGSGPPKPLVGTTIYSHAGAPVIAVQDGEVTQIGYSPTLGRFVSLRDAFGNSYAYAQLGSVAALYPVLVPRDHSAVSSRIAGPGGAVEPAPSGPATAGAQWRSPASEGAAVSGLALGAAASLESLPAIAAQKAQSARPVTPKRPPATVHVFREGPNEVYLHPLRAGVQVIAGTVLGHIGADVSARAGGEANAAPHVLFQIRPAGVQAPLIDPKPILDGWVALEETSIFRAKGKNPFLATSPTVGQVLLESKRQLEPQVLHDSGIQLSRCGRQDVEAGGVEKRVLATLEFLSVSGLKPTVAGLRCDRGSAHAAAGNVYPRAGADAVEITAVNGIAIAGHEGPGSVVDVTVRKLLRLQGVVKPVRIVSPMGYPGAANAIAKPSARDIYLSFSRVSGGLAHPAGAFDSALSADEWIKLIARLGEIPDPTVASGPSPAAIPDKPGAQSASGEEANGNG